MLRSGLQLEMSACVDSRTGSNEGVFRSAVGLAGQAMPGLSPESRNGRGLHVGTNVDQHLDGMLPQQFHEQLDGI
jgi:hypothetical protein